jgi:hypothetical protein
MKKLNAYLSLFLAMAMLVSVVASCAPASPNDETTAPAAESSSEIVTDETGRAYFEGFYGDYEMTIGDEVLVRPFHKENTGYYHVTAGPKEQKIIL